VTVESDIGLAFESASSLADLIRSRRLSARELVALFLDRIARLDPPINAIATLNAEGASNQAAEADEAIARGESWGLLHGVPFTLKDTHSTQGVRTTAGYPPLREYVPAEDGTIAARLKAAGAILLGKTNTALLAYDQQTSNPIFGRTNNPWDVTRTPSGSSGGAAAALAAGLTPLDIGSDAGGSIRGPAHFCGLYGLKPTVGLVSGFGHIPDLPGASRLDWVLSACGPLARSAEDVELALRLIAGPDGKDGTVTPVPINEPAEREPSRLRIAWARTFPRAPVSHEIASSLEALASQLDASGVRVDERLPAISFDEQWETYQTLSHATWRLRARLHRIKEVDDGGEPPSLPEFAQAMDSRDRLIASWEAFFSEWDVLLCPPCMTTAYSHCEPGTPIPVDGKPARYDDECRHTYEFNLTGHPSIVCPLAISAAGLPIGVQMIGARWSDFKLVGIARALAPQLRAFTPPAGFA
jgi:amidase